MVEKATPELVAAVDQGKVAISTAAKLATAPVEVQRQAVADPKKAVELAKAASAAKSKEIREIAKDERVSNRNHGSDLPSSWRTLYELTKLDDETWAMARKTAFNG